MPCYYLHFIDIPHKCLLSDRLREQISSSLLWWGFVSLRAEMCRHFSSGPFYTLKNYSDSTDLLLCVFCLLMFTVTKIKHFFIKIMSAKQNLVKRVIVHHMFAHLFIVWINRRELGSHIYICISSVRMCCPS